MDSSKNTPFAQTFRKANSCDHCRRQKQKCSFATPVSETCIKCAESGLECHITPRQKRTVRKKQAVGKFAWLENKPVKNQFDREQKIDQLKSAIKEASLELSRMQPLSSAAPNSTSQNEDGSVPTNLLFEAIHNKYLLCHESANYIEKFTKEFAPYLFFNLDLPDSALEYTNSQSILALALVVAYKVTTTPDAMADLLAYIDKVIIERIFLEPAPSLYIVKALIILNLYVKPTDESKIPTYILLAHSAAVQLNLGSGDDIHALKSSHAGRRAHALERCRVYMSLNVGIGAVATSTDNHLAIMNLITDNSRVHQALLDVGDAKDQVLVFSERVHILGRMAIARIMSDEMRNEPFDTSVRLILEETQHQFAKVSEQVSRVNDQLPPTLISMYDGTAFRTCNEVIMLNVYEASLNQVIFNSQGVNIPTTTALAQRIIQMSESLITHFVEAQHKYGYLPKYQFMRPLHGICALIRIRLLLWTQGLFDVKVNVERNFKRLRDYWGNSRSNAAASMMSHFSKIERWAQVRMQDWTSCSKMANAGGGPMPTTLFLQRLLQRTAPPALNNFPELEDSLDANVGASCPNAAPPAPVVIREEDETMESACPLSSEQPSPGNDCPNSTPSLTSDAHSNASPSGVVTKDAQQYTSPNGPMANGSYGFEQNGNHGSVAYDDPEALLEMHGYTVDNLFSFSPNQMDLTDQTLAQLPELSVDDSSNDSPSSSNGSTTASTAYSHLSPAQADTTTTNQSMEATLKEIFSELGSSIYVD